MARRKVDAQRAGMAWLSRHRLRDRVIAYVRSGASGEPECGPGVIPGPGLYRDSAPAWVRPETKAAQILRDRAVYRAVGCGCKVTHVAAEIGISRQMVMNILHAYDPKSDLVRPGDAPGGMKGIARRVLTKDVVRKYQDGTVSVEALRGMMTVDGYAPSPALVRYWVAKMIVHHGLS